MNLEEQYELEHLLLQERKCRTCGEKLYTAPWGETYSAFKSNGGRSEKGKRWLKPKNCREGGY